MGIGPQGLPPVTPLLPLNAAPQNREELQGILRAAVQQRLGNISGLQSNILEDRPVIPRKKLLALAIAAALPTLIGAIKGGRQSTQAGAQGGALASQFLFKALQARETKREERDILDLKGQQQQLSALEKILLEGITGPIEAEEKTLQSLDLASRQEALG